MSENQGFYSFTNSINSLHPHELVINACVIQLIQKFHMTRPEAEKLFDYHYQNTCKMRDIPYFDDPPATPEEKTKLEAYYKALEPSPADKYVLICVNKALKFLENKWEGMIGDKNG